MGKVIRYTDFVNEAYIKANMPIPTDIEQIANLFHDSGKDLFVVGGAVRDFLQGKVPHDYDLVTNSLPEESKQILCGWKVSDEQGKNFGVLRIYTKDEPLGYELAVYRKDLSLGRDTKGDDKKVEIGEHITINDDVLRRDLSINALFYDINKGEIVDLVGGVSDIENNIIRAVGNPSERFNEDRLRICRCLRFAARTGGNIDKETSDAIKSNNRLRDISAKDDVSQERIIEEWNKTMEHALKGGIEVMQKYVDLLSEYNMWEQMFPILKCNKDITVNILKNSIIFLDVFSDEHISSIKNQLNGMKFSNEMINEMIFLQEYLINNDSPNGVYKLARMKERFHIDSKLLFDYYLNNYRKLNKQFLDAFLKYSDDGIVINGSDLIKQGFKGVGIETEKQRLEIERFKNEYLK